MPNNVAEAPHLGRPVPSSDLDIGLMDVLVTPVAHGGHTRKLAPAVQDADGLPLIGHIEVGNQGQQALGA